jgi:prepilin-type N-terminal cleavage/methylation domain-containing protein
MFAEQMNKKGVTLIELVVVLVIIAIMAGLLAPNIGAWLPNYRLRSATRDIVSTMRTAQMKAVSNNIQYRVNLDDAEIGVKGYVLQYQTTGGNWVSDGAVQSLPTGISISANTLPGKHAAFNPNSTSSAGSVTLISTKGTKTITVSPATGRVRIE